MFAFVPFTLGMHPKCPLVGLCKHTECFGFASSTRDFRTLNFTAATALTLSGALSAMPKAYPVTFSPHSVTVQSSLGDARYDGGAAVSAVVPVTVAVDAFSPPIARAGLNQYLIYRCENKRLGVSE